MRGPSQNAIYVYAPPLNRVSSPNPERTKHVIGRHRSLPFVSEAVRPIQTDFRRRNTIQDVPGRRAISLELQRDTRI